MALSWQHKLIKTDDCGVFIFSNTTVYGSPNQDRNEAAEVLVVAHIDTDQQENFITVDSTPYLTKIQYDVSNTKDGHYQFELLRFPKWTTSPYTQVEITDGNDIITTYATLVYGETANKFYKLIAASTDVEPGVDAGWETYWEEITDFTDVDVRSNTTIEIAEFDNIHDCRSTICVKNELYKVSCADVNCIDLKSMTGYLKKSVLLAGARAKNEDNQPEASEKIIRMLENMCNQC